VAENFVCQIESAVRRYPERTALVWQDGALTYGRLDRLAAGLARDLHNRGVALGDRVALLIPNHWSFAVAFLGCLKLGATVAPVSLRLKAQERAAILASLRPRTILENVNAREDHWETVREPGAPALIGYSSGTSGRPKGALFSHAALSFADRSWAGPVLGLTPEDTVLAALPFPHSFGLNGTLLAPLIVGAAVVIVERFFPEAALEAIQRHRVTVFPGVATMFRRVLASAAFDGADLSSLRLAVSGAAPCPWELAQEWKERTGTRILRGYGMTELFRPISHLAGDPRDLPEAVGRPVPGVDVRIVDDAGQAVAPGQIGELLIKSPAVMEAYFDNPEDTKAVLAGGWFKTGDLAVLLDHDFVQIAGRKDERILRGGYSVFPQEVEAVLLSHLAIAEAGVIGVPDPEMGEEVAAFVALREGATTTVAEIDAHCRAHLAPYKHPRRITIMESLPRGATGKIIKSSLGK